MRLRFAIQSGALAGRIVALDKPTSIVGRHPAADLQFDPERDLTVSGRHAAVTQRDGLCLLRDLGSTNGTLVNGRRISGDHVLADHDVIEFGQGGPRAVVLLQRAGAPEAAAEAPTVVMTQAARAPRRTPESGMLDVRVQREARRQTRGFRWGIAALGVVVVSLSALLVWRSSRGGADGGRDQALLQEVDSLSRLVRALGVNAGELRTALDSTQGELARLRSAIPAAQGNPLELSRLRRELDSAADRQRRLAAAAALDLRAIERANRDAVAIVLVEFPDGTRVSGTAFAVRSQGDRELLVTARHVVTTPAGAHPVRIGVVFNGTGQNFPAELVAVDSAADLGLLRAAVRGGVPVIRGLAPTPPQDGDPVALIGFPLGLDLPMGGDWRTVGVSATATAGVVSRVLPELVQLDAFGAQGASGSPVFDRGGRLVGVLYGGERESGGRIVYAVPAAEVARLIAQAAQE